MRVGVFTGDLELYARLYAALTKAGFQVERWKKAELTLGDLDHLFARIWVWRTPWGVRAYDPVAMAFLTRQDRPSTLAEGLRGGRLGLRLTEGEKRTFIALAGGKPGRRERFFLKGLRNKFGLPLGGLILLARHQVEVMGLEGHPYALAGGQAEPGLHMAGKKEV